MQNISSPASAPTSQTDLDFFLTYLLSTYEIWKVLVSLAKTKIFIAKIPNKRVSAKKHFRPSRSVAGGFSMKFEAQLPQLC
jgi:hypothetical protein